MVRRFYDAFETAIMAARIDSGVSPPGGYYPPLQKNTGVGSARYVAYGQMIL